MNKVEKLLGLLEQMSDAQQSQQNKMDNVIAAKRAKPAPVKQVVVHKNQPVTVKKKAEGGY